MLFVGYRSNYFNPNEVFLFALRLKYHTTMHKD